MRIALGELDEERRQIFGEPMVIGRIVGEQHVPDAGSFGRHFGDGAAILAGNQNIGLAG